MIILGHTYWWNTERRFFNGLRVSYPRYVRERSVKTSATEQHAAQLPALACDSVHFKPPSMPLRSVSRKPSMGKSCRPSLFWPEHSRATPPLTSTTTTNSPHRNSWVNNQRSTTHVRGRVSATQGGGR